MSPSPHLTSPPRARLAFRVGIVGHRPNRLANADLPRLAELTREILSTVRTVVSAFQSTPEDGALYSNEAPIVRAVSPLAEGTDRLFADEALALGYELCCPMPFGQPEYEQDFLAPQALEPSSRERFRALLDRAKQGPGLVTFELDGDRARAGEAYGAAGRVVLNQSDLLIVIWDGGKPAGGGGTVQTLQEAVDYHVPVLWIDAVAPHQWRLLHSEADLSCLRGDERCTPGDEGSLSVDALRETARRIVTDEIALPLNPANPGENRVRTLTPRTRASDYFNERRPRVNLGCLWKPFRDLVGSARLRLPSFAVQEFEGQIKEDWPTAADRIGRPDASPSSWHPPTLADAPETVSEWVNRQLRPHYAWSDKPADLYADAYRSTYLFAYLMAALAVFLALLPMATGWVDRSSRLLASCITGELLILFAIIGFVTWGLYRRWHERWLEYRLLAELIRQRRFLVPLGGGRPFPHIPAHLAKYGDPTQTWMYWHVRAIARATGIPTATVTPGYAGECLDSLALVVGDEKRGQLSFHVTNRDRSDNIHHRLHWATLGLLVLTVVCVVIHLLPHLPVPGLAAIHLPERLEACLTLASATLPALSAALAGIANQGEFARIAKRSAAMVDGFELFSTELQSLHRRTVGPVPSLRIADVVPVAARVAEMMIEEVVDWRVVFTDRPPTAG